MMNLRQLKTISEFLKAQSFAATGDRIGLSASAVSIQMKELETELGTTLFDRTTRPAGLTAEGAAVAEAASDVLQRLEQLRVAAAGQKIPSEVSGGFVPTTSHELLPQFLSKFRVAFPSVQLLIKSGLSGELASRVLEGEIDFAVVTSPLEATAELEITSIAEEPLFAVGPKTLANIGNDRQLLLALPYIAFNKRAWLGQQISAKLQSRGIPVREEMELDALDAIENLVADGHGVSIVPQRLHAPALSDKVATWPFCTPNLTRHLVLIQRSQGRRTAVDRKIGEVLKAIGKAANLTR